MREGINQQITDILAASGITTALMFRLEFKSETMFVWTGVQPLTVMGSGDSLIDGYTFDPMSNGVVLNVGDNKMSYQGSDALEIMLAIPSSQSLEIAASQVYPNEYLARPAYVWRALMVQPTDPLAKPTWAFRLIRSGAMDNVEVQNDGNNHTFKLTIESHASLVSSASGSTYMDQPRLDAADTSQKYAAAIANGSPAPTKASVGGLAGIGQAIRDNGDINWSMRR